MSQVQIPITNPRIKDNRWLNEAFQGVNNGRTYSDFKISDNYWIYLSILAAGSSGNMHFKGLIDASTNPNYPAAAIGDTYEISVKGKIGGGAGVPVEAGDLIIANAANAGGTQGAVGASWDITQFGLQQIFEITGSNLAFAVVQDLAQTVGRDYTIGAIRDFVITVGRNYGIIVTGNFAETIGGTYAMSATGTVSFQGTNYILQPSAFLQQTLFANGDVRIGNAANTGLFWQISTARIGINQDAPTYILDVNGNGANSYIAINTDAAHTAGFRLLKGYVYQGGLFKNMGDTWFSLRNPGDFQLVQVYDTTNNVGLCMTGNGNVGIAGVVFGTNAAGVLGIANSTAPTTSPGAMIQIFSVNVAANNASLGLRTERTVQAVAAEVPNNYLQITINGTIYKMLLST